MSTVWRRWLIAAVIGLSTCSSDRSTSGGPVRASTTRETPSGDIARLTGRWIIVTADLEGREFPRDPRSDAVLNIAARSGLVEFGLLHGASCGLSGGLFRVLDDGLYLERTYFKAAVACATEPPVLLIALERAISRSALRYALSDRRLRLASSEAVFLLEQSPTTQVQPTSAP